MDNFLPVAVWGLVLDMVFRAAAVAVSEFNRFIV